MDMAYKWIRENAIVMRLSDKAQIPCVSGNSDFKEFQGYVAGGGQVQAADPPPAEPTADELEEHCRLALNGGHSSIDLRKLLKAKFISDLAWRLGKPPAQLTAQELTAERNRIAAIYKAI